MKKALSFILILLIVLTCCGAFTQLASNMQPENNANTQNNSNNSNTSNEDNSNKESKDFSNMNIAFFGDSIARGYDGFTRTAMDNPYPVLVAEELGFDNYYSYAVSGSTFALNNLQRTSLVNKYKELKADVDVISVMCGVNDYDNSLPLGTIDDTDGYTVYGAIKIVASGLKNNYEDAFIFFITPYNTTWKHNTTYELIDVVNAIKEVCELYDIPVLDLYNEGNFEDEMYNSKSDGLHPSQNFHIQYTAPQIAQFIKDNYK